MHQITSGGLFTIMPISKSKSKSKSNSFKSQISNPLAIFGILIFVGFLIIQFSPLSSDIHTYLPGDDIPLFANGVGPPNNPHEAYEYFQFPFCNNQDYHHVRETLGEALLGHQLVDTGVPIQFKRDLPQSQLCQVNLDTNEKLSTFSRAIFDHYWIEYYLDDLPFWEKVGELSINDISKTPETHPEIFENPTAEHFTPLIFTSKVVTIKFNGNQVIELNINSGDLQPVQLGKTLEFKYSIQWVPTDIPYHKRWAKYLDIDFFEHNVHFIAILNSFVLMVCMGAIVVLITVNTVSKDFASLEKLDPEAKHGTTVGPGASGTTVGTTSASGKPTNGSKTISNMPYINSRNLSKSLFKYKWLQDDGWKQVRGDVFRSPPNPEFVAAFVGTGYQLGSTFILLLIFSVLTDLYLGRGSFATAYVVVYALSGFICGYTSSTFYTRCKGKSWIKTYLLSCILLPALIFGVAIPLSVIAAAHDSMAHIPLSTFFSLFAIWLFLFCPLNLIGTLLARHSDSSEYPQKVNPYPRDIPQAPAFPKSKWWLTQDIMAFVAALYSFSSVIMELYFLYAGMWSTRFYYVFGLAALSLIIFIVLTGCAAIVFTFVLLNSGQNHEWQWTCLKMGAWIGIFTFIYSIVFFFYSTHMSGFLSTTLYFGRMFLFSIVTAIFGGSIAFAASETFLISIYKRLKFD